MANLQDITNRSEVGTIKPWGKATAPNGYLYVMGQPYRELLTQIYLE